MQNRDKNKKTSIHTHSATQAHQGRKKKTFNSRQINKQKKDEATQKTKSDSKKQKAKSEEEKAKSKEQKCKTKDMNRDTKRYKRERKKDETEGTKKGQTQAGGNII